MVRYRVRETGLYGEPPYVDEWKPLPPRLHHNAILHRTVHLGRFAIASHEVTHGQYAEFLRATGYQPARPERFRAGHGRADAPVAYVDLTDARAYAQWAGTEVSVKLLLLDAGLTRSPSIGFRCAVDLEETS